MSEPLGSIGAKKLGSDHVNLQMMRQPVRSFSGQKLLPLWRRQRTLQKEGEMEELEKAMMAMLVQMVPPVIGAKVCEKGVQNVVLAAFPNFVTFNE